MPFVLTMFICLVLTEGAVFASESPLQSLRYCTTDYKGVVSNGSSVLCYGTHGIMARSTDKGLSWKRVSLGNEHVILRIDTLGYTYVALTQSALFISVDNAKTWNSTPLAGGIDLGHHGDSIYILTRRSILSASLSSVLTPVVVLALDSSTAPGSLAVTARGTLHWIQDEKRVISLDLDSRAVTSSDILTSFCISCQKIVGLQAFANTLFVAAAYVQQGSSSTNDEYYTVVTSSDYGISWRYHLNNQVGWNQWSGIANFKAISDSEIVALRNKYVVRRVPIPAPDTLNRAVSQQFLMFEYVALRHSSQVTTLNPADTALRRYTVASDQRLVSFVRLDSNVIIGAGDNHCIVRSSNNGKYWDFVSYFPMDQQGSSVWFKRVNAETMHMPGGNGAWYKTDNGGVTILPQRYAFYPQFINSGIVFADYSENGKGCVILATGKELDSNVFETRDNGETYVPIGMIPLLNVFRQDSVSRDKYRLVDRDVQRVVKSGNVFIVCGTPTQLDSKGNAVRLPYSIVLRIDTNYRLIDTVIIPVRRIRSIIAVDSQLYLYGMNRLDYASKPDLKDVEFPRYALYRSIDDGASWDSIPVAFPFPNEYYISGGRFNALVQSFQPMCAVGRHVVSYAGSSRLLLYSIDSKNFDTLVLPFRQLSPINRSIFLSLDDRFITAGSGFSLMSTNVFEGASTRWESKRIEDLIPWDSTRILAGLFAMKPREGFAVTGEYKTRDIFDIYKTHILLFDDSSRTVSVHTEKQDLCLHLPPFPIPTRGRVSTTVSWEAGFTIDEMVISVYDALGNQVSAYERGVTIELSPLQEHAGLLTVDFTGHPSGVYFIHIDNRSTTRVVPVVVN